MAVFRAHCPEIGRTAWSGVPCFRLPSIRAFPEGHEGLGAGQAGSETAGKGASMPLYEHVYLARQDLSAQQVEELSAQYKGVIEQLGGTVAKTEYWGVKSLTFRMRKNRKAHFTLMNIEAPPAAIVEVERQERLSEDILRTLTVRVDELEAGPSAMMRKADRDRDRDDRRGDRGGFDRGDRGGFDRGGGGRGRDRDGRGPREDRDGGDDVEIVASVESDL